MFSTGLKKKSCKYLMNSCCLVSEYFVPYHHEVLNYDRVSVRTLPQSLVQVCPVCVCLWPVLPTGSSARREDDCWWFFVGWL